MRKKLKIIIIMTVALGISSIASNTVFIAATPYVNKPFLAQMARSPGLAFQSTKDYIAAIGKGRTGVESYQQQQVQSYIAKQEAGASGANAALPPATSQEDFTARGYERTGNGIYAKENVAAGVIEIYFTEDAKFEKQTLQVNGESVDTWVPL